MTENQARVGSTVVRENKVDRRSLYGLDLIKSYVF